MFESLTFFVLSSLPSTCAQVSCCARKGNKDNRHKTQGTKTKTKGKATAPLIRVTNIQVNID